MITCYFEDGAKAALRHAVVDVVVARGKEILMVKRSKKLSEGGKWGLTGGYVDRDETVLEAAAREVFEESGWNIKELTLLTVIDKPHRPAEDRQNISFVFCAGAANRTGQPDWESDEVKWFALDELPPRSQIAFDHADIIEIYRRYLAGRRPDAFSH